MIPLVSPKLPENRAKKESPTIIRINEQFWDFQCLRRGNPILCLQKGILSSSCLPAFGKVDFRSLYRLISHCESDFSFASERDSHFFDKMIVSHFSPHVNHVKLFHLVVLDSRSVRGPGRSPCPDALLRVGVIRGWMMDWWVYWWVYWWTELSDGLPLFFEEIEAVLMGRWTWLFLVCDVRCCLFAQSLLCLRSPLLPLLLKFHRM